MPKIVVKNDPVDPLQSVAATTVYSKTDGLYYIRDDGTIIGPLGVGIGGSAGGSLTGTYPNPGIANGAVNINQLANGSVTGPKIANAAISLAQINPSLIDPIPALPGLRTLGSGPNQAVAGNDPKLYNARVPTGPAGGDLSGTYPGPTLAKIQGYTVDLSTPPAIGEVLTWDGTKWEAAPGGGGGITQLTADVTAGPGSGSQAATVVRIQTYPVSAAAPAPGDGLVWNGAAWAPAPVAGGGSNNLVISLPGAWLHAGLAVRDFIKADAVANTAILADASTHVGAIPFVGMITAIPAPGTATVAYYGEVAWTGPALTPGARYFLDPAVPGGIVTPAPAPVVGQTSLYVGYAKNSTLLFLNPGDPTLL